MTINDFNLAEVKTRSDYVQKFSATLTDDQADNYTKAGPGK